MTVLEALRRHSREAASEAFGLGAFLFSACFFAVLLEHPLSPAHLAIPSALERRAL
ncbi:MAG: aquaporin family protein, partial [Deltaproteobacteria bacterium]